MDLKNAARLAFTHLRIDLKEKLQPILHGKYHGLLSFFPSKPSTNRLHPVFDDFDLYDPMTLPTWMLVPLHSSPVERLGRI
jgi:hypothetical protein